MEVKTLGVIGAGQMGAGIAQVAAASGLLVIINDIKQEFVDRGLASITKSLQRNMDKGKLSGTEKEAILARIKPSTSLADMASADFVIDAASENEVITLRIFQDLNAICGPHVILASNTSSFPISRIAANVKRPDKIIGMHFMNPAPVMKLVEIICALATSAKTLETTLKLARRMDKTPTRSNDYRGFISNRILNQGLGEPQYQPFPLLRQYVEAGWLGHKSDCGFITC